MTSSDALPVAVIGAGPVGLAAAAHLIRRGLPVKVYEAGETVAANVRDWGHVRLFSPWEYNTDTAARALLQSHGWQEPPGKAMPTGSDLYEAYLKPLVRDARDGGGDRDGREGDGDHPAGRRQGAQQGPRDQAVRARRLERQRRDPARPGAGGDRRLRHVDGPESARRGRHPGRGRGRERGPHRLRHPGRARARPRRLRGQDDPGGRRRALGRQRPPRPRPAGGAGSRDVHRVGDPRREPDAGLRRRPRRPASGPRRARLQPQGARRQRAGHPGGRLLRHPRAAPSAGRSWSRARRQTASARSAPSTGSSSRPDSART